tara:strand:+ start:18303 stop:18998 length:696 start_codon:yes stop_codon:yes gene_type:complete
LIQHLNWDSDFFNLKIGKVLGLNNEIIQELISKNYDLLYVFSQDPKGISNNIIKQSNAQLVDSKVIFQKEIKFDGKLVDCVEFSSSDSMDQLFQLALESGHKSRFKLDENFEKGKFEELYNIWIKKAVNETETQKVFVYRDKSSLGGFVTIEIKNETAVIGLIAVHDSLRGQGIGKKLMNQVESYLINRKIPKLEVATQLENSGACKFYEQLGFEIKETIKIYHLWKKRMV